MGVHWVWMAAFGLGAALIGGGLAIMLKWRKVIDEDESLKWSIVILAGAILMIGATYAFN
jgi:hypothetical protein